MSFPSALRCLPVLAVVLGALSAQAQTCPRKVDYPMTVEVNTPASIWATEVGFASGQARFYAWRLVDEPMKADLDASLAAGCIQEMRGFTGYARLSSAGYCTASYSAGSNLDALRPSTGQQRNIRYWSEYESLTKFGGELMRTYKHRNSAPAQLVGRARVGDEVFVAASVNLETVCFGDPDSIADRGEASYDWGAAPAPVVRIWLP